MGGEVVSPGLSPAHGLQFSPLSRSEMKRWMISLAPNRRTKFVSFTSRLSGKIHCVVSRSFSPPPRVPSVLISPSSPRLEPSGSQPLPGLPLHFHPLVSRPGSDFVPLQPRVGCTSTLHPSALLSGAAVQGLVQDQLPFLQHSSPLHLPSPHGLSDVSHRIRGNILRAHSYTYLSCFCLSPSLTLTLSPCRLPADPVCPPLRGPAAR